jgi:ornithine--oxo-acid transaminase
MSSVIRDLIEETLDNRFELYREYISPTWVKMLRTIGFDRTYTRAEGPYLFDQSGNRYLDFMCNWGVFNFGRNHPTIRESLLDVIQSDFPGWIAFDAPLLAGKLAHRLCERMPNGLNRVYFCNSGTEAAEAAIKYVRAATGKFQIVYLRRAFHGLTNGSLSLNGEEHFRSGFGPHLPGGIEIACNDYEGLESAFASGQIGGFIFEPIQGKGVHIPDQPFLLRAQELCRKHHALLICDEVQTGIGRTGKFCAWEWVEGLDPDIVLLAKALSGGYVPVGAMITRREIHDKVFPSIQDTMRHSCTFGMSNLAMAAGLVSLYELEEEGLMENAQRMGQLLKDGLEAMKPRFEFIKDIRQRGLMIGIEFGEPRSLGLKTAWAMIHQMDKNLFPQAVVIPLFDDHRILTQVAGHDMDIVKLLPPLNISDDDARWFLTAFEQCMVNLHRFPGPVWEVLKKLGKHALSSHEK